MTVLLACGVEQKAGVPESASGPPKIVAQPDSLTIGKCDSAEFTVGAIGATPLKYQWYRNGKPLPGANLARYTVTRAGLDLDGSGFSARVENSDGSVVSSTATLGVTGVLGPVRLAEGHVFGLGVIGNNVVWTDGNRILVVSADCSSPERVVYERRYPIENTDAVAVVADRIVWTDQAGGTIRSASIDGGFLATLASGLGTGTIQSLTIAAGRAYWANLIYGIQAADIDGGGVTVLPVGPPPFVVNAIAADDGFVYWADNSDQTLKRMQVSGGPFEVLASAQGQIGGVALMGEWVLWTSTTSTEGVQLLGSIRKMNKGGGKVIDLVTQPVPALKIAVDGTFVYWTSGLVEVPSPSSTGFVARIPLDGSDLVTVLASGLDAPFHVQVDDRRVYWNDRRGVWMLEKPAAFGSQ